jgi:hypothetical protein
MWQMHSGSAAPQRTRIAILGVLSLVMLATSVSCARHRSTVSGGGPTPAASSSAPQTPAGGRGGGGAIGTSAAGQLAAFFAGAQRVDGQLRHAALAVNNGIGTNTVALDPATVREVRAIDAIALAGTLPPGVDDDRGLLRAVLLVYSELVSRQMAFVRVVEYAPQTPLPRSGPEATDLIRCLGNGGPAAARFAADLAAAKSLAASSPALAVLARDSRAAADLAVRASYIHLANRGCGNCGGSIYPSLTTVVWMKPTQDGSGVRTDGTIEKIPFGATYDAVQGRQVRIRAC